MGKDIALVSILIVHFGIALFCGFLSGWGFVGGILTGVITLLVTTAAMGTGLVGPATIGILILAGLGGFNILLLFNLVTGVGVSANLLSSD